MRASDVILRLACIAEALTRTQTIKLGMTRKELLVGFTTEGGLYAFAADLRGPRLPVFQGGR